MKKLIVLLGDVCFVLTGFLFVLSTGIPAQAAIPASERAALIAFYNATNGDNWLDNDGWKTPPLHSDGFAMPGTENNWYGISVSADHVLEINLSSNWLSGSIPPKLVNLSNLQRFTLFSNFVSGSIPPELGYLVNLSDLTLDFNQLSGNIPPELGNLGNLQGLSLSSNQLSGSIPPELGNLVHLQYLSMAANQLNGSIPPELSKLENLHVLSLGSNQLSGSIPPELGNLIHLHELSLGTNQLSSSIPPELGNLANLQGLSLGFNQLNGSIPPELGNLGYLQRLSLYSNQLSGSIPPELGNLTNLQELTLGSNHLSGSIPPELGKLTNLQELILIYNQLSGSIPTELGNLDNLEDLSLRDNQLTGSIPLELGNLGNLQNLSLRSNQLSGHIPPELGNLGNIQMLSLASNQLSGSIPLELENLGNLQGLFLNDNQLSGSIPSELGNLSNLQYLILNSNRLSGNIPPSLTNLTNLEFLHINNNCLYTDDPDLNAWIDSFDPGWETTQCAAEKNPPFGSFDTPIHGSTVYSSIPVTGWALDDSGIDSVKIYREQGSTLVYIGEGVFVEGARPDVAAKYPDYPNHTRAGWGYMMLTNFLPNSGNGPFVIHAVATDVVGKTTTLGTKTIHCDNANAVKPFGAIDSPTQGGTASGRNFINWGWVLTPPPNHIPTDGSTINVYVDGVNLGHPNYNIYRSDIADLFPGYANSNGAAGYFNLNTTVFENGVHTIQWTARDSIGNTDGIGSRYFSIRNTGNSASSKQSYHEKPRLQTPIPDFSRITNIPVDYPGTVRFKKGFEEDIEPQLVHLDARGMSRIKIKEIERVQIYLTDDYDDNSTFPLPDAGSFSGYLLVNHRLKLLPVGSTLDRHRGIFYWQPGPGFIGEYRFVFIEKVQNRDICCKNIIVKIVPRNQ